LSAARSYFGLPFSAYSSTIGRCLAEADASLADVAQLAGLLAKRQLRR
jgi:hypothetical protein